MRTISSEVQTILKQFRRRYFLAYLAPCLILGFVTCFLIGKYTSVTIAALVGFGVALLSVYILTVHIWHRQSPIHAGFVQLTETILENAPDALVNNGEIRTIGEYVSFLDGRLKEAMSRIRESSQSIDALNQELEMVNQFIENGSVVLFEWPVPLKSPALFVSGSISYFGYSTEEFTSGELGYYDFVHPEDRERVQRTNEKARESNLKEYTYMYRILTKNGDIKWVEDWTLLIRDSFNRITTERGILRDVTHEVQMNEQMSDSETRFRELFDNAGAIIFTYDFEGRFISANRACLELFEFDLLKLKTLTIYEMLSRPDCNLDLNDLRYMETYLNEPVELHVKSSSGKTYTVEARNSLLFKDDLPSEIQTVAIDITDRKKAEAQVQYLTYHDRLTGLYNRLYFDRLIEVLEREQQMPLAVIIGDMNGLKLTNDAFGHRSGDDLLVRMAHILKNAVSGQDALIARLSGDEFSILLPESGRDKAEAVCKRIRDLSQESEEAPIRPSIALGYGCWDSEAVGLEEIIREAEDNMYHNKLNESKSIRSSIIQTLQASLEEKTTETREHAERLRKLSVNLGFRMSLSGSQLDELALAAAMHDIGKIGIPDALLVKPEGLTSEEWQIMRKHPEIGYHIILSSPSMAKVAEFILAHHERWDGTGYPRKLKGEDIPLISRIIAVVDAYDVMLFGRPYRSARLQHDVLDEIEQCSGTQFDPIIAKTFVDMIRQMEGIH